MKSTADRYGTIAVALHWLSGLLILGLLAAGFAVANAADSPAKAAILRLDVPIGVLVLLLVLLVVLHVGAALHHHFVRLDRLMARMGIGR